MYRTPGVFSELMQKKKGESRVGLMVKAIGTRVLITWEPLSDRILTTRFRFTMNNISIVQFYAPTMRSNPKEKVVFSKQIIAVQQMLPRNDIVIVMSDLNT